MKEWAKQYTKKGLSVIPVGKDKRPLISWKEFQTRIATNEEIDQWFEKYPEAQVGIVTGKISNLTVVDVEKGGDAGFLPQDTMIIKTGGGGWHYYFNFEPGVMNSTRIRELVDIRSEGGYVVAPPSETEKGEYVIQQTEDLADFPKHLFPQSKPSYQPAQATGINQSLKHNVEEYAGYGPGERNDQMTRFIGTILRRVHGAEWDTVALSIIREANKKNTPPLSDYELLQSFKSIRGREILASQSRLIPQSSVVHEFPDDGSDEVLHLSEVAAKQTITVDRVIPLGMPCFDNVIMGGAVPGDLIIIGGETGNGKTTLMQDFAANFMLAQSKKVLLFTYEVMPQFMWDKFKEMGITEKNIICVPLKNTSGTVDWIEKKILEARKKFDVDAVCIDHMGFLAPKQSSSSLKSVSANYSTYLTQIARELKSLAIKEEVPIIVPVHVRKTQELSLNDIANSAGLGQESDIVFLIQRERAPKDASTYYTEDSVIWIAKNRRTGQTPKAWFTLLGGRFAFNNERNNQEELMNGTPSEKTDTKNTAAETVAKEKVESDAVLKESEDSLVDDLFAELTRESEREERDKPF